MPPKTLTAEQVAEIDRQQKPAFNPRNLVPQREDLLADGITAQKRREAAPATLSADQVNAAEARASVAAMTPFGRAMGAKPDRTTGPVVQPKKRLSATEVDQIRYEQISNPAYMPTQEEFNWYEGYKKTRDDKIARFGQAAWNAGGGIVQMAAATAYAPFDFIARGTKAYDEWVNSSAEGVRQTGIGMAELWSWAGDVYEDNQKELQRHRDLNNDIRKQLAAENKFTGDQQADEQILGRAIEQAKASGLYDKNPSDLQEDDDTRYQRFIRDRSFVQQASNITETNIGTLPDGQREMGIDPSKVNPGLVTLTQFVVDPLNVATAGLGVFGKLRLFRRAASLTGTPLKGLSRVAKAGADKVEDLYGGIVNRIESRTGMNEATAMSALNNPVTWRAVAAMAALKTTGKVLRRSENWLETGSVIAKEMGVGGVGVARADAATRLRNAPIPERYRRAYDGFFTSADSTLRRVSETPGLSPIARRSAATLDNLGATQAFRLADDAISGAASVAPVAVPLAVLTPEDRRPELLGSLAAIGAMGGAISGKAQRVSQMDDALVAKMLADAEVSGGDAVSLANMIPHDRLVNMAMRTSVMSAKADFVPLRGVDYELNTTIKEAMGQGTKGIYVDARKGARTRVFVNLDKLASGDVAGHEIGHAILKSDILGGKIKRSMRAMVDAEYGADGLAARGREYAKAMLTQEVNHGTTGIKLEVLTPEEVNRMSAGVSEADLIRDRWAKDTAWRDSVINDRVDLLNQERLAKGEMEWDWARDEIAAETFSGLGKGINLSGLRASGPLGRAIGAAQTAMEAMGARFRGNGRLESPNKIFTENPLFDTPQMRKAVNDYTKMYDRYLVGLEKEGAVKQRGTPITPTGKASDAARSPHTRVYPNGNVVESDLFIVRPDGTLELKSQQMINTQEKARAATLKSINSRDRLVPENSQEWGARRLSNGRIEVGGPTLPPQFDHFIQIPEWLRAKAREKEAKRVLGQSYLYSYNAIGTGESGSYKVKNLGNVEAKTGEAVFFGWSLSKNNHLLEKVIDLNSFRAATMRAIDNQQLGEFGNDLRAAEAGLKQLLKNYNDGVPGETGLGVTRKNILNGLLGTGTPTHRASNPVWHTLNNQGSVRTFRFDRLNYADAYDTGYFPHYEKININALPDDAGRMSLDDYMRFDADRQAAWLNNRARERGYTNSTNWANSDEAGFAAASDEYRKLFPRQDAPATARGSAVPDLDEPKDVYARSIEDIKAVIPPEQRFVGNKVPGSPVLAPDGRPYLQHDLSKPTGNLFIKQADLDQAWKEAVAETGPAAQRALDEMRARGFNMAPPNEAHWRAVGSLPLMDRFWYETSAEAMVISFPGMAQRGQSPKVMDTVAATSPLADPNYNAKLAISFLSEDFRHSPAQTPAVVPKGVSDALLGTFGREEQRKIGSFGGTFRFLAGLSDDPPLTTNDRQVASSFSVPDKVFGEFPVMYEAVSRFYNKLRDTINSGQADKSMGLFEAHQLQALSWVQHRAELEMARNKNVSAAQAFDGDAYAVAFKRAADELRAEGIAVASDPGTGLPIFDDAVLSNPRVTEILAPTSNDFMRDTFQTMKIVTKLNKTGGEFLGIYEQSKALGIKGNVKDAETVINRHMNALTRRKDLGGGKKAPSLVTDLARVFDEKAEITRIESGYGTFKGDFGQNLRIPLGTVPEQYRPAFLAILGKYYQQEAQAASRFVSSEPGQAPTSYSVFFQGRVDTDFLGDLATELSTAGHEANVSVRPNGIVVDVMPQFGDSGPVPINPARLKKMADRVAGNTTTASVIDRDFSSIYLERSDYGGEINKAKKGLLNDTAREIQQATGATLRSAKDFAGGTGPELSGNKAVNRRAAKARDRYRQRLSRLESVEARLRDLAKEFQKDMAKANRAMKPKLERRIKAASKPAQPAPAGLDDL